METVGVSREEENGGPFSPVLLLTFGGLGMFLIGSYFWLGARMVDSASTSAHSAAALLFTGFVLCSVGIVSILRRADF